MEITSSAFKENERIPSRYTGEGEDVSPPLEWSNVPDGCRAFALICEDPDATPRGGQDHPFVHWLLYNISPSVTFLPEGLATRAHLEVPVRAYQGKNSFGKVGYGGPMPPAGYGTHHYVFRLYALGSELALRPEATKTEFLKAIDDHVLAEAELIGTYRRETRKKSA